MTTAPATAEYQSSETFTFHNSTDSGNMDMYSGTQLSVNTFFVQLEKMTGLCAPYKLAQEMGVELADPDHEMVPSFTLGIANVSPLEMAEAYATAANRGVHCDSTPILEIRDRNGDVIPTPGPQCNRVLKPAYADAINDILKGVMEPGGFGQDIALDQPSAGKTGTVAPAKSVWFVGYTPTLSTAAMIAGVQRNGKPMNIDYTTIGGVNVGEVHGSTTAGPMWGEAMRAIERWLPDQGFTAPDPGSRRRPDGVDPVVLRAEPSGGSPAADPARVQPADRVLQRELQRSAGHRGLHVAVVRRHDGRDRQHLRLDRLRASPSFAVAQPAGQLTRRSWRRQPSQAG